MNIEENNPKSRVHASMVAWLSLCAPLIMVFFAFQLPKDDPPLHRVNVTWYFQLTVFVCFCSIVSAVWSLIHRKKGSIGSLTIAILGILVGAGIGWLAFIISILQDMPRC